jgi:hypothetical protein
MTANGRNATLQAETGTFFNAFVIFTACGEFQLVLRFVDNRVVRLFAWKDEVISLA